MMFALLRSSEDTFPRSKYFFTTRRKNINLDPTKIMDFVLSKDGYNELMREKRKEFLHKHFEGALKATFDALRKDAEKGNRCNYTATFIMEDHFDQVIIQDKVVEYFKDLGYHVQTLPTTAGDGEPKSVCIILS